MRQSLSSKTYQTSLTPWKPSSPGPEGISMQLSQNRSRELTSRQPSRMALRSPTPDLSAESPARHFDCENNAY